MKHKSILIIVAVVLCVALVGTAAAQGNKPDAPEVAITTKFTQQGKIERNGAPFTGTCDMRFTLWDAATAGNQLATYTPPTQVTLTDGVFAVEVDFGMQFTGDARWVQSEAKCADDVAYTNLPRVALNATPYAIGLVPGSQTIGSLSGTGGIIRATNTGTGAALVGLATSGTGTTYGVLGNAFSPNGYAVWGYASGGATGVQGVSASSGSGVVGQSASGFGVVGNSPTSDGVRGTSTSGSGVFGQSATGKGVYGDSPNNTGVYGTSATGVGVWGDSTQLDGVRGIAHAATKVGVLGNNDAGIGVLGTSAVAHTYDLAGVSGVSTGDGGIGVKGTANTGTGSYGVYGVSTAGYGVVGQSASGYAGYFLGKVGITGADLAERFAAVDDQSIEPGTVVVVDQDQPGKIRPSDRAYDTQVIGIISGAGGVKTALILHQDDVLQGDLVVAVAGRVYCKAEANSAPIKPGDLLTTSKMPGHCMKATDRDQAYGAVIGKALTGLDKGEGLVFVLVNLQ
jgi:hypothetical protein